MGSRWTVAMWLAKNGIIPPIEWYHDKYLTNDYTLTVGMLLSMNGIIP